jgi:hypothetical protein
MEKTRYGMAHDRTGLAHADYYDVMLEEMREHSECPGMFNKREVLSFKIRQAVHYILFLINADWEDCKSDLQRNIFKEWMNSFYLNELPLIMKWRS